MTSVQDNKKIALFMGGKTSDMSTVVRGYQNIWLPMHGICRWDTIDLGRGNILCYHKSWDWLVPVVDKILSDRKFVEYGEDVAVYPYSIEKTYNDVIKFIDWYDANCR